MDCLGILVSPNKFTLMVHPKVDVSRFGYDRDKRAIVFSRESTDFGVRTHE
jgi:hypothetical protein